MCPHNHCFILFVQTMFKIIKFNFLLLDGNSVPNIILGTDYGKSTKCHKRKYYTISEEPKCVKVKYVTLK